MKVSDGVQVLLLTAIAYIFTYAFYQGFYYTKGIPTEFLSVDIVSMLKIGVTACVILSIFVGFVDGLELNESDIIINKKFKIFLIRYGLLFLTLLLFMVRMLVEAKYLNLFVGLIIPMTVMQSDLQIRFKDTNWKFPRRFLSISFHPRESIGSVVIAKKVNIQVPYVFLSWFLAFLFLMSNMGSTFAHLYNETLTCQKGLYVIQVHDSDVLVTRDYKTFKFVSKDVCEFKNIEPE